MNQPLDVGLFTGGTQGARCFDVNHLRRAMGKDPGAIDHRHDAIEPSLPHIGCHITRQVAGNAVLVRKQAAEFGRAPDGSNRLVTGINECRKNMAPNKPTCAEDQDTPFRRFSHPLDPSPIAKKQAAARPDGPQPLMAISSLRKVRGSVAEGLHHILAHLLRVPEQHHRVGPEEQFVIDAGIARRHRALDEENGLGLLDV